MHKHGVFTDNDHYRVYFGERNLETGGGVIQRSATFS